MTSLNKSGISQDAGIAGETGGIAGDIGDAAHLGRCQGPNLRLRPGPGRVQHHGIESRQLQGRQRLLEQIPFFGGDGFETLRLAHRLIQCR